MFSTVGYHAVSLRDLAKALSISAGSLYHHFDSKQDLLYSLIEESLLWRIRLAEQEMAKAKARKSSMLSAVISGFFKHAERGYLDLALAERESRNLTDEQRAITLTLTNKILSIFTQAITIEYALPSSQQEKTKVVAETLYRVLNGYFFTHPATESRASTYLDHLIRSSATHLLGPAIQSAGTPARFPQ